MSVRVAGGCNVALAGLTAGMHTGLSTPHPLVTCDRHAIASALSRIAGALPESTLPLIYSVHQGLQKEHASGLYLPSYDKDLT